MLRILSIIALILVLSAPVSMAEPPPLIEAASVDSVQIAAFAEWLDAHGQDPESYVVSACKAHQVVIFGELHGQKAPLLFLADVLPKLYHEAGVRCLGLEVCSAEDNRKLRKLVTGETYDEALALKIARSNSWGTWGLKEQWDVLRAVWWLNRLLPEGAVPMRVIGIDRRMNLKALFMMKKQREKEPEGRTKWIMLRFLLRHPRTFYRAIRRDELMAAQIEKQIVKKGERGIVWVGANHAFTYYRQPKVDGRGKLLGESARMAYILHQKYGDSIFQIALHIPHSSPSLVYKDYKGPEPTLIPLVERIMARREHRPGGFDVVGSPLADLRDQGDYYFYFQPKVCFSDIARGYLYLAPLDQVGRCTWIDGFITEKEFHKNRRFYEMRLGKPIKDATELNAIMKEEVEKSDKGKM